MKVFIPHYSKLVDRKANILSQFKTHNITDFTFIENLDAEQLTVDDLNRFALDRMGDPRYTLNVISLFLKHIYIYELIALDTADYALIFEDDVILSNDFNIKLNAYISELPEDFDALFIGDGCNLHVPHDKLMEGKHLYEIGTSKCTDSYIISKKCAIKLLDYYNNSVIKIDQGIDWWLNYAFPHTNCRVYWAEPTIVTQGSQTNIFLSSLGH